MERLKDSPVCVRRRSSRDGNVLRPRGINYFSKRTLVILPQLPLLARPARLVRPLVAVGHALGGSCNISSPERDKQVGEGVYF